ncbi:hypothetical protein [Gillisia lutea]|nr:hypothetical protein [Gillisia lutea]
MKNLGKSKTERYLSSFKKWTVRFVYGVISLVLVIIAIRQALS